jgi:hypothetical protein
MLDQGHEADGVAIVTSPNAQSIQAILLACHPASHSIAILLHPPPIVQAVAFCEAARDLCAACGAAELAPRVAAFARAADAQAPRPGRVSALLQNLAVPFIRFAFPQHAGLVLVYCTLSLMHGPSEYHAALLMLLTCLYQASNLDLGDFGHSGTHVTILRTLVLLLEGDLSEHVDGLLDTVLTHLAAAAPAAGAKAAEQAAEPLPADFLCVMDVAESCEHVAASLQQCLDVLNVNSTASATARSRANLLPFIR